MIKEIIDALPERQREAIVLHYYSGLNVTEAAKVMDISHAGVSLYLKLARKKIKEELENIAEHSSGGMLRRVAVRTARR